EPCARPALRHRLGIAAAQNVGLRAAQYQGRAADRIPGWPQIDIVDRPLLEGFGELRVVSETKTSIRFLPRRMNRKVVPMRIGEWSERRVDHAQRRFECRHVRETRIEPDISPDALESFF